MNCNAIAVIALAFFTFDFQLLTFNLNGSRQNQTNY